MCKVSRACVLCNTLAVMVTQLIRTVGMIWWRLCDLCMVHKQKTTCLTGLRTYCFTTYRAIWAVLRKMYTHGITNVTRHTFCGTWYLLHNQVHNDRTVPITSVIRPPGVTPWGLIKRCCLFFLFFFYLVYPPSSRDGWANPRWRYTISWGPSQIGKLSRQISRIRPLIFTRGQKPLIFDHFWPKFRPHLSSGRHSFDLGHLIGNLKQTCQGPMVDVPPHQIWCRSVPPTLRSDGAKGTPKCKSGKFLTYSPFLPHSLSRAPPDVYQLLCPRLH